MTCLGLKLRTQGLKHRSTCPKLVLLAIGSACPQFDSDAQAGPTGSSPALPPGRQTLCYCTQKAQSWAQ